jgi:uncharacterized protein YcbK (DUF882 family)
VPQLSKHFHSREFQSHDGGSMPRWHLVKLSRLCRTLLEPLREEFGPTHVVSGYRSVRRNQEVGGARHSFHLSRKGRAGAAADVRCERGSPADWYEFLDACGAGGLGLYRTHVHVDTRSVRARWSA